MKIVERFALMVFSLIVLILTITLFAIMFSVVDAEILVKPIYFIAQDIMVFRTALVINTILFLLAVKALFFPSKMENLSKDGIVLENASGKLVISRESLENLVASVAKEIPGAESVTSRTFLDKDRNLKVYVTTTVSRDMTLKEVSTQLQDKIKTAMKETADLEVKEVNIRVKNISSKKVKTKTPKNNNTAKEEPVVITEDESKEEEQTEGEE